MESFFISAHDSNGELPLYIHVRCISLKRMWLPLKRLQKKS